LALRSQKIFGMPMAFEAPSHAVRLRVINNRHGVDPSVTNGTANSAVHVSGVIIKDVVRRPMQLNPFDRLPILPTGPHRFQFRVFFLDLRVTRHAGLGVRHIRVRCDINEAVTIATIHSQLRNMHIVGERDRLHRLVPDTGVFWGDVIPSRGRQATDDKNRADRNFQRQPVGPAWKKVRHGY
jgi:hypothetical protein